MKLKSIIVFVFGILFTNQILAQEHANILLEKALVKAQKEHKNVFIKYGASWCTWCKKMDKQMKSDACKDLFDKEYVTVNLTVKESKNNKHLENPGANELLKKQNGDTAGLPFWVILDANGKLIEKSFNSKGENLGCPATREEIHEFISKLKNTSNLSQAELDAITLEFKRR